jgi:2-polyprenyl-3-methyl-5-hydroxy-6-metoxy-1,4-benzoquinol methylase
MIRPFATPPGADARVVAADVETSSDSYARRFAGAVGAWFLEVQARTTLALLEPFPRSRVLDVGGGHGQLTGPLVEAGHDVTVFGSDPACGERVAGWVSSGRARFASGDLLHLPFDDRAFDVVLSFRLLPHVEGPETLIGELARLAGRAVIVDYPTRRSANALAAPLFEAKRGVEGDTRPFRVFGDAEIASAFESAGLFVTARAPQFVVPMAAHRALGRAALSRGVEAGLAALGLRRLLGSPVIARAERRG